MHLYQPTHTCTLVQDSSGEVMAPAKVQELMDKMFADSSKAVRECTKLWSKAKTLMTSNTSSFFASTVGQLQESLQECQQFSNEVGMALKFGSVPQKEAMNFQQQGARLLGDLVDKAKAVRALMSAKAPKE